MNTQQLIIIFSGAVALITFILSHARIGKVPKILLGVIFFGCIVTTSALHWRDLEKKQLKEIAYDTKIDQIDIHVKASLTFADHMHAARINKEAGRLDEAIYDVERALEKKPYSAAALNLLGVVYFLKEQYDNAIYAFSMIKKGLIDSTIIISSGKDMYHRNFGEAYMEKSMWKEAKEELVQSLSLNDSNLICYLDLARTLDKLNDPEGLYKVSKKGATLFSYSAPLHNFLGKACIAKSRFDEAEQALLKAVEADSTFGQPYLFLGVVYFKKNQPEKSLEFVKTAISSYPNLAKDAEILRAKKLLE